MKKFARSRGQFTKFGDITDSDGPLRLMPEKGLREWIQDNVNLKLKGVPWDLADEGPRKF